MDNPKLKSALIGGGVFGVLAALPYIQYVNVVCCALYLGGGMLAVYLYLKDVPKPERAPYGDGAVVGLLAGLLGAVASTLTTIVVTALGFGQDTAASFAGLEQAGVELPEFLANMMGASGLSFAMVLGTLLIAVIFYGIFATLGGLLGVAIFHKKDPS